MNNRQNGRRRGRGGQQARNGQPGAPDRGSRLDNRARGNAAQLLEKYKTLARDAQMQGDRVNTEYYLQFADHYFRVLSENRSRFEEQQRGRRDDYGVEGEEADQRGYPQPAGLAEDGWDDGDDIGQPPFQPQLGQPQSGSPQPAQSQPVQSQPAQPQPGYAQQRSPREFQPRRDRPAFEPQQADAAENDRGEERAAEFQPRRERGRRGGGRGAEANGNAVAGNGLAAEPAGSALAGAADEPPARIEIDLPPALTTAEPPADVAEAPKRRRTRRPKAEGQSEPAQA